jgi:hypothetical protein
LQENPFFEQQWQCLQECNNAWQLSMSRVSCSMGLASTLEPDSDLTSCCCGVCFSSVQLLFYFNAWLHVVLILMLLLPRCAVLQGVDRRTMLYEERLEAAERRRKEGNALFAEAKYTEALAKYAMVSN